MRIFAGAGEFSGDRILSEVLAGLRTHFPAMEIRGFGGPRSQSNGLVPLVPFEVLSVNGLWDTLRRFFPLLSSYLKLRREMVKFQPNLVLLVDYPGMNERLIQASIRFGFKTLYIAPPQLWVYLIPLPRMRRLQQRVSGATLQVLFPFEREFYSPWAQRLIQGHFFSPPTTQLPKGNRLLLCPGSRADVLERNLPAWLERIAQTLPGISVDVLVSPGLASRAGRHIKPYPMARLVEDAREALARTGAAITFPGTMSLELFLHRIPTRIWAIIDLPTLWVGKRKLAKPWIGLPNLLMDKRQVPEWVGTRRQFKRTPPTLPAVAEWMPVSETDVDAVWAKMGPATGRETGIKACLELLQEFRVLEPSPARR